MNRRILVLSVLAVFLIGLAIWAQLGSEDPIDAPPALTVAELGALPPTLDGDLRMMDEARRHCGADPGGWRKLPEAARTVYATLWAEEVHRTATWAQRSMTARDGSGEPTFEEIAAAYTQLGSPETARAVLSLDQPFAQTAAAYRAWLQDRQEGRAPPPPSTTLLDAAARTAFSHLDQIRPLRLQFARAHAESLGIR